MLLEPLHGGPWEGLCSLWGTEGRFASPDRGLCASHPYCPAKQSHRGVCRRPPRPMPFPPFLPTKQEKIQLPEVADRAPLGAVTEGSGVRGAVRAGLCGHGGSAWPGLPAAASEGGPRGSASLLLRNKFADSRITTFCPFPVPELEFHLK